MKYDDDTLKWLIDRSNVNILRFYKNNLKNLPSNAKYELLREGIIIKSARAGGLNNSLSLWGEPYSIIL